ncbi:MAG: response regulator [Syntrophobacterales bacterium]|jgi:two-component system KDP operon response regulator KdpE|nr:response regulator [Syntrophobacterales bacterium]
MNPIILLIEDDFQIRRFLRASLVTQGFDLIEAETGREGLALAASQVPEVILLDLGLPDMEGIEVIKQLRLWTNTPIIILSARGQERDKVANLDAGADDYLTKPFGVGELLARIRVALRKAMPAEEGKPEAMYALGNIKVDFERRLVFRGPEEVHLTPIEYKLLAVLVKHRGKVVTHRQLLKEVWGPSYIEQNPYLRIFILNLRRKLEDDPTRPHYLLTEPGVGYRLRVD